MLAALQPVSEFGRVYAAYGGIFIALSLAWEIVVDASSSRSRCSGESWWTGFVRTGGTC